MRKNKKIHGTRYWIVGIMGIVAVALAVVFAFPVLAQGPDFGVANLNGLTPLKGGDLKEIILRIIQILLGFLALVAVILMLYAGFLWMTARGDKNQVDKAKKVIRNAIIGMAIIILSYSIVLFVFALLKQAGGGPGQGGQCTVGECTGCFRCNASGDGTYWDNTCSPSCSGGPLGSGFRLRSVETAHEGANPQTNVYACSNLEGIFNNYVNQGTVDSNLRIVDLTNQSNVAGDWNDSRANVLHFDQRGGRFTRNREYQARFPKTLTDTSGLFLSSCDVNVGCTDEGSYLGWRFAVGELDDSVAPFVTAGYPEKDSTRATYPDRDVSPYSSLEATFNESISVVSFMDAPALDPASPAHPRQDVIRIQEMNPPAKDPASTECQVSPRPANCLPTTAIGDVSNQIFAIESVSKGFRLYPFAPNSLKPFTWYQISIAGVKDLCGNTMAGTTSWTWQTNGASPGVSSTYPTGAKVCTDSRISFTFGTSMYDHRVALSLLGSDGSRLQIAMAPPRTSGVASVTNADGTLRIVDARQPVDNHYRVFEFIPRRLSENATYNATVSTDLVINVSGATLSKTWQFTTSDAANCVCEPYISQVRPGQGPVGMCVTISGYCFSGKTAQPAVPQDLRFNNLDGVVEGYGDTYLVSTVPTAAAVGDRLRPNFTLAYPTSQAPTNNQSVEFYVDQSGIAGGPCLFSLIPTRGSVDTSVTARGKNFGDFQAGSSRLVFSNNVDAPVDATSWAGTTIASRVPQGAVRGEVTVSTSQGTSNGIEFIVLQGINEQCSSTPGMCTPDPDVCDPAQNLECSLQSCLCARRPGAGDDTTVRVSRGTPACSAACPNSVVELQFSKALQSSSVTASSVSVLPCTTAQCDSFDPAVPLTLNYIEDTTLNSFRVFAEPSSTLRTDSYYRVVVLNTVQGAQGETLTSLNFDRDGNGVNDSYSWTFKTKAGMCALESIDALPDQATISRQGGIVGWYGSALGSNQQCSTANYINPSGLSWNWTQSNVAVADLTPNAHRATSKALAEGQTLVRAESTGVGDESLLTVAFLHCTRDAECVNPASGGTCPGSTCDDLTNTCKPVITSIIPATSAIGDLVSINGCYFGNTFGRVKFTDKKYGIRPDSALCGNTWSDRQIVVEVPKEETPADPTNDAVTGRVAIRTAGGFSATSTTDLIIDNSQQHPGICALRPSYGRADATVSVRGKGFGDTRGTNDRVTFAQAQNVADYVSWSSTAVDVRVPAQAVTGDVVLVNDNVQSNPKVFTVLPGGLGSVCGTTNQQTNVCSPNITCNTGLWCPTTGANACTCQPAPALQVSSFSPVGSGVCPNAVFSVTFNQKVDRSSVNNKTIFAHKEFPPQCPNLNNPNDVCLTDIAPVTIRVVDGNFTGDAALESRVDIIPQEPFDVNTTYAFLLRGGDKGVKSIYGTQLTNTSGAYHYQNEIFPAYHFGLLMGSQICELTSVEVTPSSYQFTQAGQEQPFQAIPKSGSTEIVGIPGVYDWSLRWDKSETDSFELVPPSNTTATQNVRALRNGQGTLTVTATITTDTVGPNSTNRTVVGNAAIEVFLCDNPWAYDNAEHNMRLQYCRDGSPLLPAFGSQLGNPPTNQPTVNNTPTQVPDRDEIMFDSLFLRENSKDAIGFRIYKNLDYLDPRAWYNRNVSIKGSPSATTIDGFDALRDGRTVYIAAVNPRIITGVGYENYTNIYVLSYNEGADADTKRIFEQIVSSARFMVNITDGTLREELVRDGKRIQAVGTVMNAVKLFGSCPPLASGSYLVGRSTSAWPSWNQELGRTLGVTLPKDPDNKFNNCPSTHDPATCWNPLANGGQGDFQCPDNSFILQYRYQDTQLCTVSFNLERKRSRWMGNAPLGGVESQTSACEAIKINVSF